ncbi:MAG: hypothetical protein AVDCRST_MAG13-2364, partial [uncultured Solirubrobacteraceae bacterium]
RGAGRGPAPAGHGLHRGHDGPVLHPGVGGARAARRGGAV